MIIYCAGAIKGDTTFQENYIEIINYVESLGHTALAELNGKFNRNIPLTDAQIYKRDIKWIEGSNLMIAEISGPSLGVGFEIAYALFERKIPVLALASNRAERVSAMITGCDSNLLTVKRYSNVEDTQKIIFNYIKNMTDEDNGRGINIKFHKSEL